MERYLKSDLACENFESRLRESEEGKYSEERVGRFKIIRLERGTGTEKERYVTLDCGRIWELDENDALELGELLSCQIRDMAQRITGKKLNSDFSLLVVGLGNAEITADAIGPQTVRRITATRHLKDYDEEMFYSLECCEICAISPGVLGQTGIESADVIKGVLCNISADLVIVIDALAARSCDRLAATVQISNVGIDPGAGIGNHRVKIDAGALGVPMLAIGVPTVVNSSALICDALIEAGINATDARLEAVLEKGRSFYVSPKESDVITQKVSELLARAIKLVFSSAFSE